MSAPCGSSEQADGLREGFEEGRELQETTNTLSHMEGSRQNCTEFHANGISRWSALGH